MIKFYLSLLLLLFFIKGVAANGDSTVPRKQYNTHRLLGTITLDGLPNEEAWSLVDWGGDFVQHAPNQGIPPSYPTRFKILYDDRFLYLAYDAKDVSGDSVSRRMGRRDEFPGDWVEVNIDSHHDKRSGFSFTLSASGVRGDEAISNDGNNWDGNWNPIWFAKTHINTNGWTAEVKIPLSQLRYSNDKEKVWGIQIQRKIFRKEERSTWQLIPRSSGVWVSAFGELHGLNGIPVHRQIEIAPYVTAQLDKYKKEPGNPFADGSDTKVTAGVDGKVAITNDLILDFTVNPDFGQVEADPSEVRIDGFQSFFDERRPFFIESRNIFEYQLTGSIAGGDYDADLLFYSRRIGSTPHGYVNTNGNEYVKYPQNTSILGATKFSGKTKNGWSIGILESITEREHATIDSFGKRRKEIVEPFTSYFAGRLQKDMQHGNTIIGGIFTAVNRENALLDILHRNAYSAGLDFLHYWKNRQWQVRGKFIYSRVEGTREAMLNTQTGFEHLFQRPNATEFSLDSSRTSLTGTGGTLAFGKLAGKPGKSGQVFKFETGATYRSPQLELNDIGFMLTSNEINYFGWAGLNFQKPFSVFRNAELNYNHWLRWDFTGQMLYKQFNTNANVTFKDNWQAGTNVTWNPYDISNTALRGAGSLRRPDGIGWNNWMRSDFRKKVAFSARINTFWGFHNSMYFREYGIGLKFVPTNAFNISFNSSYNIYSRAQDQFVRNINENGFKRTVVARVDQQTLRFTARLSYNITPDLTIQYYGQPFLTRPLYSNFAWVSDPLAKLYKNRFTPFNASQLSYSNNVFIVDENLDGARDYSFRKPDFNYVEFHSNLIVRWEYKPGSEFYLVWAAGNTADAFNDLDTPVFRSLTTNMFTGSPRNSFLVKCTYRFAR